MSIKLIVTSTRPERNGGAIADRVAPLIAEGAGIDVEIVDLREVQLPLLDEPAMPAMGNYQRESTRAWARVIADADAVVFLSPEYNGGFTAAAKNALDTLYAEWDGKVAAVVGYGYGGAGRAVPQLEQIMRNLKMAVLDEPVLMPYGDHMADTGLTHDGFVATHADALRELGRRLQAALAERGENAAA